MASMVSATFSCCSRLAWRRGRAQRRPRVSSKPNDAAAAQRLHRRPRGAVRGERTSSGSRSCSASHRRDHWSWNQEGDGAPKAASVRSPTCSALRGGAGGRPAPRGADVAVHTRRAAASDARAQRRSADAAHMAAAAGRGANGCGGRARAATAGARSDTVIASSAPSLRRESAPQRATAEGEARAYDLGSRRPPSACSAAVMRRCITFLATWAAVMRRNSRSGRAKASHCHGR